MSIEKAYEAARQRYSELGVDTEKAIERLAGTEISLHCWQGDDVGGFETSEGLSGGGLVATGAYPGGHDTDSRASPFFEPIRNDSSCRHHPCPGHPNPGYNITHIEKP